MNQVSCSPSLNFLRKEMPELMSFSAVKKDKTAFVAQSVRVPESGGFFLYRGDEFDA